jgi:hypothetical protein
MWEVHGDWKGTTQRGESRWVEGSSGGTAGKE